MRAAAADLAELARTFASIVERLAEAGGSTPQNDCEWIDQTQSPLGPRLHNAAVRRRMAEGKGGAAIKARRHLLTREALREEMMQSPKPGLRKTTGPRQTRSSVASATAARMRAIRGKE